MTRIIGGSNELASWIRKEIQIEEPLGRGARGQAAKRIQEWLNLHNMGIDIDGDFGGITEKKVKQFQDSHALKPTGIVDNLTFQELTSPIRDLSPSSIRTPSIPLRVIPMMMETGKDTRCVSVPGGTPTRISSSFRIETGLVGNW
jgi:Putative peptidoglycan binding domain